jgi:hypothetical protein
LKRNKQGPKVLILDIETSPLVSTHWGLFDQNISIGQIQEDWSVISWAAKWLNDKNVMYQDTRKNKNHRNDKVIIENIWKLVNEADIVIGQNSISFDMKKLNSRFLMHGLPPPSPYRQLDTKRLSTKYFANTSNKLEYLSKTYNTKYKKLSHSKFPGMELWHQCLKGNISAWEELKKYNIHDVLATEELYLRLAKWDNSINFSIYDASTNHTCSCGNQKFKQNGTVSTNSGTFELYTCTKCGSHVKGKVNLLDKDKRLSLKGKI